MANRTWAASVAAASAATILWVGVGSAAAGGTTLAPDKDRYEPGDVATLVGYTGGPHVTVDRGRTYRVFLSNPHSILPKVEVGQLDVTETNRRGWESFRVSVTFRIPRDTRPGEYYLGYCADPCTGSEYVPVGDIVGGFLFVGVDPPWPPQSREWPLDEPQIANLADTAMLSGPGYRVTAGDVRAGYVPPPFPYDLAPQGPPAAETPSTTVAVIPPVTTPAAAPAPGSQRPWALPVAIAAVAAAAAGVAIRRRQPRPTPPPSRDDDIVLTYEPAEQPQDRGGRLPVS